MNPTLQDLRYDPILSNVSVAYKNEDYIAEQVFPVVKVARPSGKYYEYDTSKFRVAQSLRGMGSKTNEVERGISQSTAFVIKEHALKELVPDEEVEQSPQPLTPEMDATENVTERILVQKEKALADYMASESNLTNYTTLSGTSQWSDYENSDPIDDVRDAKAEVHAKIFKEPNTLILGKETYNKLVDHPDIIDRIKYSALGVATPELMARLFDIQRVLIGAAGYEGATEGQSSSMSYIWGKHAWVAYIAPRPAIKQMTFGYHFQDKLRAVDKWYVKDEKGTFVRVTDRYTREVVSVNCVYFIKNAVA